MSSWWLRAALFYCVKFIVSVLGIFGWLPYELVYSNHLIFNILQPLSPSKTLFFITVT